MHFAQLVFHGGTVLTADGPITTAVAVRGNLIAAVGAGARELIGPATEVVDLAGGLLAPGFQDAHIHPVGGGLNSLRVDLLGLSGAPAYLAAVAAYATAHPDRPWITGGGWAMADFPGGLPTAPALDAVVADRPVLLHNRDCHGAWANTRALELAGITERTPEPPDGRIERGPGNRPTGMLHEGAVDLVTALIPPPTRAERLAALRFAQRHLHSLGITAWQDAILGDFGSLPDASADYAELAARGELTARVTGALWWQRDRGLEQIEELRERRDRLSSDRFRATSVKIMQDGVAENFTASMLEPYLADCPHPHGLSFVDPAMLHQAVAALDADGFHLHFHAIGDRAVRDVLDAVEHARAANEAWDRRHHIAHVQVVNPADLPRFAALDVTATIQPLWATNEPQMTELTLPILGPGRAAHQYSFAGLRRAGARLAAGSDWPVSRPDPLWGIHVAVNRTLPARDPDHDPEPFLPGERLTPLEALTAYTAGSAHVNNLGGTGTIAPGNLADLVVLDRDILTEPVDTIADARVLRTYVDGDLVFHAR
ncbi:putative amidohydrolase YtcJ [Allocatelliglobosispora scoriae]|uniref:Putative amidohydrolase YtcJ n=1 Tax=Allocatelliglobosispora scoriae TaxID=643052 RepID=A0A841BYT5_9ACTN|nr:amidohydrolase [Allocatelliglobosispora scoriae]MBB5872736.1 putative amidohydrolase YtcJ [Allocatelliglobosispora scoriae]